MSHCQPWTAVVEYMLLSLVAAKILGFWPHKVHAYDRVAAINMSGPTNTLLIEGSFEELADELAHYLDEVQKKQTPDSANVQAEITSLLETGQKDEALKKLVTASDVLNTAPEKGGLVVYTFIPVMR